jgi:hypothetical protein
MTGLSASLRPEGIQAGTCPFPHPSGFVIETHNKTCFGLHPTSVDPNEHSAECPFGVHTPRGP